MTVDVEQVMRQSEAMHNDAAPVQRLDDLAQIIQAYNDVTEKLQRSHDTLSREVVRLQKELASTDAQLQRSRRLAALGEMAAGIAHEIRNPLAGIQLYAEMIRQDLAQVRQDDGPITSSAGHAGRIVAAVRGLNAIVNDVLCFARELKLRRRLTPVDVLIDRVIECHRPAIEQAGVSVRRDAAVPSGLEIDVDPDQMQQALVNLVRNAVDAMDALPSDAARVLTLSVASRDGQVLLRVRDTGPGIAEADIDRIFNPFFTTRNTGTGLGLAIVHSIVDAHGGAIVAYNDRGAVFDLTLPMTQRNAEQHHE